jgi:DNA-binding transcriptional ArsR family regulator
MTKLTLDMNTFKALASDTRLDILKALDGKKLSLKDISRITNLNKATLHEHLTKLNEAGLVKKKEREGHKWVYYKLTWKGEGLLHPENTRIVVMFSATFISLLVAVIFMVSFLQPITVGMAETYDDTIYIYEAEGEGIPLFSRDVSFNYLGKLDAKEQIVQNITDELKNRSQGITNSLGIEYTDEDIQWITPDKIQLNSQQKLVYNIYNEDYLMDSPNIKNNSINESNGSKAYFDDSNIEFSSINPEIIAIVQDTSLLYFAVCCITVFIVLLTLSTWRFLINKKAKF